MAEAARPGYSSDGRGRMVLVVHQANDGSASYTLLAAMRTPLHDAGRGRNEVAFRQIGDAHANGHRQSLAESGVVFPGDAQGGSRDREAIALIAIPN